ncbi:MULTISPECIES: GIN domain-containing protein [unclassified Legionella]|uniref:GIN domain-containing protein n=1 Tax=unclassified Legionella TaxID=2622702 RepID=UPI001F5E54F7|nr:MULTISPECIES: DUF2807 domain-containing protein [unclassified Legionella]MDI9819654.1 DUF2807 domain-containing protein [Legionella sp. PL877]
MGPQIMLMRFFFLFFILLASGCTKQTVILSSVKSQQNRFFPAFNQVKVEGNMNVNLRTGYSKPQVILRGDPADLLQVKTEVRNGALLVILGKGYPRCGSVSVEIRGHYLNTFSYQGSGEVKGANLRSGLLDLSIDNSGRTTLGGNIVLRRLTVSGGGYTQISGINSQYLQLSITGKSKVQLAGIINISKLDLDEGVWLGMYWVKSKVLTVHGKGRAFMQLAGIVDRLEVELWGNAHFNGRYLRANRAFVRTHDRAVADIAAVRRQHTLATGASDIYFYNLPTLRTDFMAYDGSVLDMREWDKYAMRDYDRYNKILSP